MSDIVQSGFYLPELKIERIECNNRKIIQEYSDSVLGYYQLYFVLDGKYTFKRNQQYYSVEKHGLIIGNKSESIVFHRTTETATLLRILFHEKILEPIGEIEILNFFAKAKEAIYPNELNDNLCCDILLSLEKDIQAKHKPYYVISKTLALIGELNLLYSKTNNPEDIDQKNIAVSMVNFVDNNFTTNITYKLLRDKYFTCDSTINKIFKTSTSLTLNAYINRLRLNCAINYMKNINNELSLNKIAELSGFKTYSTFYREYMKRFGRSPKDDFNREIKNWPLQ